MNERALRVLEFTKIRDTLASYALSDPGKEKCRAYYFHDQVCLFYMPHPPVLIYSV